MFSGFPNKVRGELEVFLSINLSLVATGSFSALSSVLKVCPSGAVDPGLPLFNSTSLGIIFSLASLKSSISSSSSSFGLSS